MRHRLWKTCVPAAVLALSGLVLTGCGGSDDSPSSGDSSMPGMNHSPQSTMSAGPAAGFGDADVAFATQMIPHHQQAVQMSELAARKAVNAEVKRLAAQIKAAQAPEIKQLSGWLTGWGKPVPTMSHEGHDMPGMMTAEEMADLGRASGARFDRMWVQMMIRHHQGAITMAKTEQTTGKNAGAIALAKTIETAQNREITTMRTLRARL